MPFVRPRAAVALSCSPAAEVVFTEATEGTVGPSIFTATKSGMDTSKKNPLGLGGVLEVASPRGIPHEVAEGFRTRKAERQAQKEDRRRAEYADRRERMKLKVRLHDTA